MAAPGSAGWRPPTEPFARPPSCRVGTQAAVKGLTVDAVRASGAEIVLANTYHLMIRPGAGTASPASAACTRS